MSVRLNASNILRNTTTGVSVGTRAISLAVKLRWNVLFPNIASTLLLMDDAQAIRPRLNINIPANTVQFFYDNQPSPASAALSTDTWYMIGGYQKLNGTDRGIVVDSTISESTGAFTTQRGNTGMLLDPCATGAAGRSCDVEWSAVWDVDLNQRDWENLAAGALPTQIRIDNLVDFRTYYAKTNPTGLVSGLGISNVNSPVLVTDADPATLGARPIIL